jgi:cell division protein FtsQ
MTRRGLPVGPPPGDLDLGLAPVPEESPFLRRQVRSRVRVRPRRRGWSVRLLIGVQAATILLLMVAGTWAGYRKLMASERLDVARVEVQGSQFLSEGEVRELLGPAVGENILSLDIAALKARLRSSPWVADATVTRTLPDTVRVDIRERVPLALAEVDRLYLMDGDGALVDIYGPRTGVFDLPIVRGLHGVDDGARRDRARRAGVLLSDLAELGQEISEVFVEPSGDLRVVLRGPGEVLLFGNPPYRQRFVTFLSLRRELAERAPGAEHFDLRFRGRIYARTATATSPLPEAEPSVADEDSAPRPAAGISPPSVPGAPSSLPAGEDLRPVPSPWGSPGGPANTSLPEARGASFTPSAATHESRRAASASGALRR